MDAGSRWVGAAAALALGVAGGAASVEAQGGEPGLAGRDDVVLQDGFEDPEWFRAWGLRNAPRNTERVEGGAFRGRYALRVHVPAGGHYGTSFAYEFAEHGMDEPDEVYFRYALRLGPSWTTEGGGGGKFPGFGGTYDTAGWGGRPSDGTNGWSARGLFWPPADRSGGATRLGFYAYHADMEGPYGDNWYWSGGPLGEEGVIRPGRWYQVEVHVRNNTPGVADGVLRAWVDGTPVFEKRDVRFRDVERLRVQRVWFDLYYGGSWTAPADMYVDFDNVVVAWGPIGPVADAPPPGPDGGVADAGAPGGGDAPDGGTPSPADGGRGREASAGPSAGEPGSGTGGCGCGLRAGGGARLVALPPWLLLGLALALRRRRLRR